MLVASASARLDRGAILVVAGVLAYAVYTVLLRSSGSSPDSHHTSHAAHASTHPVDSSTTGESVVLAAATAVWGLVFLLPWQVWEVADGRAELPAGAVAIAGSLYLGLVASAGTLLLWTYGAARTPASLSGALTAAIPALGYAFAVVTGEPASWTKTAGGVLAVAGVLLSARAGRRPTDADPQRVRRPSL